MGVPNVFENCFNAYKNVFPFRTFQLDLLLGLARESHLHLFNTSCILYSKGIFAYNELKIQR